MAAVAAAALEIETALQGVPGLFPGTGWISLTKSIHIAIDNSHIPVHNTHLQSCAWRGTA